MSQPEGDNAQRFADATDDTTPSQVYVIAEAGSCHEERLGNALELVRVAARAKASACKFQYWSSPARMRERRRVSTSGTYDTGSIRAEWFPNLRDLCHDLGMSFACSVYLPEDVETVARFADVIKISSFEARDEELYGCVLSVKGDRPLFVSTGMSEGRESVLVRATDAIYLHCVSAYPCPIEEANL